MNKEKNTNHILIQVLNNYGDLKLTKFRNPRAMWQNNNYPDDYVFRDVDTINVFQLIQENKQLKDNWNWLKDFVSKTKIKEFEKAFGKRYGKTFTQAEIIVCNMVLDKMQKLEKGSENNE